MKIDKPVLTTIALTSAVRDRLRTFGIKGETYDTILVRLMDKAALAEVSA